MRLVASGMRRGTQQQSSVCVSRRVLVESHALEAVGQSIACVVVFLCVFLTRLSGEPRARGRRSKHCVLSRVVLCFPDGSSWRTMRWRPTVKALRAWSCGRVSTRSVLLESHILGENVGGAREGRWRDVTTDTGTEGTREGRGAGRGRSVGGACVASITWAQGKERKGRKRKKTPVLKHDE
jgi:hypothetical protein